jgi:hypothetical protein
MIRNYRLVGIAFCFLCLMMAGCSSNGTKMENEAEGCPSTPEVPVAQQLDTLNIIIETSGSMAGFMPTRSGVQTDFQRQLDDLLANAESMEEKSIRTVRYYSARDRLHKEVYSRFNQILRQGLRNVGSSSPIPQMLNSVTASHVGPEQVSIFISDFIYAPPNRRDRDFVANDIRRAIAKLRRENMVVSVFASQSGFSGTFYPAGSTEGSAARPIRNCCDTKIPYYLWVIGPEEKVRMVNQEVIRSNYYEQVHFGFDPQDPGYRIIPGSGRQGAWYPADEEGKVIRLDNPRDIQREPFAFTIGLNLEGLAPHMADATYLQDNLKLQVRNGEATLEQVYNRQTFINNETVNQKDRSLLNCYSHYVKISVDKVYDPRKDIEASLVLENQLPAWIEAYTTQNDSNIEEEGPRTFLLDAILEGARRASERREGPFFKISTRIDLSR